jgi:hypothetical protein
MMDVRLRRRIIMLAVVILFVALAFFLRGLRNAEVVKLDDHTRHWEFLPTKDAQVTEIPTPKDTQGVYGMKSTVSADGTLLAVAGNPMNKPSLNHPGQFTGGLPVEAQEKFKVFLKNIYWSKLPADGSSYNRIADNQKIRSILAMAISNKEPRKLAFLSRESKGEIEGQLGAIDP